MYKYKKIYQKLYNILKMTWKKMNMIQIAKSNFLLQLGRYHSESGLLNRSFDIYSILCTADAVISFEHFNFKIFWVQMACRKDDCKEYKWSCCFLKILQCWIIKQKISQRDPHSYGEDGRCDRMNLRPIKFTAVDWI